MPETKPLRVTLHIDREDEPWLRKLGDGLVGDGLLALVALYRMGKRPVVEANEPVVHQVKRPIYQAEE